jgi:hypothetical protein
VRQLLEACGGEGAFWIDVTPASSLYLRFGRKSRKWAYFVVGKL